MNDTYIITVYVMIDDILRAMNYEDDCRAHTTSAEIMTIAIVAAKYFQNHHERAVCIMRQLGYVQSISVSRFNRRLHQLMSQWLSVLDILTSVFRTGDLYIIDSMPMPVCKLVRANRCVHIAGKQYYGRSVAKQERFFGFRLHLVCTSAGIPVAFDICPASWHDLVPVQHLTAELSAASNVLADKGYVCDEDENLCYLYGRVNLIPLYRKNMIPNSKEHLSLIKQHRPMIEAVYSQLEKMGVQRLHNRTLPGRFIKLYSSLLALIFNAFN